MLGLKQLERSNWMDKSTSEMVVSFLTYNAQYDLLVMTEVYFFFSQSGHIWKNIIHSSLILQPYKEVGFAISDAIFVLMKLWITITELRELFLELHLRTQ